METRVQQGVRTGRGPWVPSVGGLGAACSRAVSAFFSCCFPRAGQLVFSPCSLRGRACVYCTKEQVTTRWGCGLVCLALSIGPGRATLFWKFLTAHGWPAAGGTWSYFRTGVGTQVWVLSPSPASGMWKKSALVRVLLGPSPVGLPFWLATEWAVLCGPACALVPL